MLQSGTAFLYNKVGQVVSQIRAGITKHDNFYFKIREDITKWGSCYKVGLYRLKKQPLRGVSCTEYCFYWKKIIMEKNFYDTSWWSSTAIGKTLIRKILWKPFIFSFLTFTSSNFSCFKIIAGKNSKSLFQNYF